MTAQIEEGEDFLAHYGKKGMKWGERKAVRQAQDANIRTARGKQEIRKSELNTLSMKRLQAHTTKGKEHLDQKIADKQFEILNHPDAKTAAKLTTGEKWVKGGKTAALMGLSIVGLGSAASIGLSAYDNYTRPERMSKLNDQIKSEFMRANSPVGNADGGD